MSSADHFAVLSNAKECNPSNAAEYCGGMFSIFLIVRDLEQRKKKKNYKKRRNAEKVLSVFHALALFHVEEGLALSGM